MQPLGHGLRRRRHAAAAGFLVQMRHAGAVGADQRVDDAVLFARLDEDRAGGVAEQHAGGAVGVVDDRRHLVGADHHDLAEFSGLDELRRDGERIDEAGARRLHVEAADVADADHVADQIGGRRKDQIRCRRGANQKLDVAGRSPGFAQQSAHRLGAHMRGAEPFALEDVAFADAGALDDPLVAGIDHLGQLGVGENVGRHVAEHPGDRRADRGFPDWFSWTCSRRVLCRFAWKCPCGLSRMTGAMVERRPIGG